jgi:hypothetical protein
VFVWLIDIGDGLARGQAPDVVQGYTTYVTAVIDIGVIAPTAFSTSVLLFRRASLGYVLAPIMLIMNSIIGVIVVAQTVFQGMASVELSTGQYIAFVAPFTAMSLLAAWLTTRFFRSIADSNTTAPTTAP